MGRHKKTKAFTICKRCGLAFERWRIPYNDILTIAKVCPSCREGHYHRSAIITARLTNPCATLEQIAKPIGITRERVRQVLKNSKLPTKAKHQTYTCFNCGRDMGCKPRIFCSWECRHTYTHPKIACEVCDKLKEYNAKFIIWGIEHGIYKHDHFFCSKACQGKWLGKNYGIGRRKAVAIGD